MASHKGTLDKGLFLGGQWMCNCEPRLPAIRFQVKKDTPNKGRYFYCCQHTVPDLKCRFFLWADEAKAREKGALLNNSRSESHPEQTTTTMTTTTTTTPSSHYAKGAARHASPPNLSVPAAAPKTPTPVRRWHQQRIFGYTTPSRAKAAEYDLDSDTSEELEMASLADKASSQQTPTQPSQESRAAPSQSPRAASGNEATASSKTISMGTATATVTGTATQASSGIQATAGTKRKHAAFAENKNEDENENDDDDDDDFLGDSDGSDFERAMAGLADMSAPPPRKQVRGEHALSPPAEKALPRTPAAARTHDVLNGLATPVSRNRTGTGTGTARNRLRIASEAQLDDAKLPLTLPPAAGRSSKRNRACSHSSSPSSSPSPSPSPTSPSPAARRPATIPSSTVDSSSIGISISASAGAGTSTASDGMTYDLTGAVMALLRDAPLAGATRAAVRAELETAALRHAGVARSRDVVRAALRARDARVVELQARVAALENVRRAHRDRIRRLAAAVLEDGEGGEVGWGG